MHIETLLVHGTVITMDTSRRLIADGAVAIHKGRILEVGHTEDLLRQYTADLHLDCTGKAVLPGFIDAHGHAGHALTKTLGVDSPSHWMDTVTPLYHHFTTDEFWYTEGKLAALERLKMGVTCGVSVISSAQRSDDPVFAVNNARGYNEVGIRQVLAVGPSNPPFPRSFSRWRNGLREERAFSFDELMAGTEGAIQSCHHTANDRTRVFVAPFVLVTSIFGSGASPSDVAVSLNAHDRLMMRRVRELAAKYSTRIHTEAFGGMVHMAAQDEWALLGPDVHIQHCTGISMEEVKLLAESKTHVSSAPGAYQGTARCPIPELMAFGANVCITTDGTAPSISFDLLQAARSTRLIQQVMLRDSFLLPAGTLLEAITINAAKAIGWDDELGSLEAGKKADVVVLNLRQPHLAPDMAPVSRIMHKAVGSDVDTVLVDGVVLMANRRTTTVCEDDVMREAQEEAEATLSRAGLRDMLNPPLGFWGQARLTFAENPAPKHRW